MMSTHRHKYHTAFLLLFALAVTIGLGACETDNTNTETETTTDELSEMEQDTGGVATGQDTGRATTGQMGTANQLDGDPAESIGERVQIQGSVEEEHAENAFTVDYGWTGGSLLVIVPDQVDTQAGGFSADDEVQVTGTLQEYMPNQMQQEYNLGQNIQYNEGEAVLIADEVSPSQEGGGQMGQNQSGQ